MPLLRLARESDEGATPLILVQEITHRVVNEYAGAIAAIRMAAAASASGETKAALAEVASHLVRFVDAHRALQAPLPGAIVDLGAYLETLCAAISSASLRNGQVTLNLSTIALPMPGEDCWLAALIVAELITNAIRHGVCNRAGHVAVELSRSGSDVVCRIRNDGVATNNANAGRGSHIVCALAVRLGGQVHWEFSQLGTVAQLSFPLNCFARKNLVS